MTRRRRGLGYCCTYCERRLEETRSASVVAATKDHVLAKSHGGARKVWCCRQCNMLKSNMTPVQWSTFMRAHPEWWKDPQFRRGIPLKDRWKYIPKEYPPNEDA